MAYSRHEHGTKGGRGVATERTLMRPRGLLYVGRVSQLSHFHSCEGTYATSLYSSFQLESFRYED